jgi:hypothetical protein
MRGSAAGTNESARKFADGRPPRVMSRVCASVVTASLPQA